MLSRRDQPLYDRLTDGPSASIDIDADMNVYVYTIATRPRGEKGEGTISNSRFFLSFRPLYGPYPTYLHELLIYTSYIT